MISGAVRCRSWIVAAAFGCVGFGTAVTPSRAGEGVALYDLLKVPAYRKSWVAMLNDGRAPVWLVRYATTFNGPSVPLPSVLLGARRFQLGNVCKPHDCGSNQFYALFAPEGRRAWGLL